LAMREAGVKLQFRLFTGESVQLREGQLLNPQRN
jgi:hypothetical protein